MLIPTMSIFFLSIILFSPLLRKGNVKVVVLEFGWLVAMFKPNMFKPMSLSGQKKSHDFFAQSDILKNTQDTAIKNVRG